MNTRKSVVQVVYELSGEYREKKLIETGRVVERKQIAEIDLTDATPEQRRAVVAVAGPGLSRIEIKTWKNWSSGSQKPWSTMLDLDQPVETIADLVGHCERMVSERKAAQAIYDEAMRESCLKEMQEKITAMREHIANRTLGDVDLWQYQDRREAASRLEIDRSEYDRVRVEYDAWAAQRKAELDAQKKEAAEKRERERAAREREKLTWIKKHGSDYLKRAVAAGHTCTRQYLRERAAFEYPGFVLDFNDSAEWKERSCPTEAALDERDALLEAHPDARKIEIVWLTSEPSDEIDPDYYPGLPEGREAIVVNDPTYGKYWLVK